MLLNLYDVLEKSVFYMFFNNIIRNRIDIKKDVLFKNIKML